MKYFLLVTIAFSMLATMFRQSNSNEMEKEVLRVEEEFGQAMIKNDADKIGTFLADDWIIIDPDGGIIDKARFLDVIKSGALTHEMMKSDDTRVRIYGDTAIVTALTTTKGKFHGQAFATKERASDVFVKQNGRWRCALSHLTSFSKTLP